MTGRIPLFLLPGYLDTDRLWQHQVENLADDADITVANLTNQESITQMASMVLAQAPEGFALAGLSMGGYTALEIMRQAPERVSRLLKIPASRVTSVKWGSPSERSFL